MAAILSFQLDTKTFLTALVNWGQEDLERHVAIAMRDVGRAFTRKVQQERLRGGTTASSLGRRTGAGARSLGFTVVGAKLEELTAFMGFGPPAKPWVGGADLYMEVHETGAVIRPVNNEFLALPGPDNLTGAGVARVKSPRDLTDPEFLPHLFSSGMGFLVFEDDALMFMLMREVIIPPRLNFQDDWDAFQPEAMRMLDDSVRQATTVFNR